MRPIQIKITRHTKIALTLAAALSLISCGGTSSFTAPPLTSLAIVPSNPVVQINTPGQPPLQAWGTDTKGNSRKLTSGVTWASFSTQIATIDSTTGVPDGVAPGTTTFTARSVGLSATATATTYITGITAIQVTPTSATVSLSGSPSASFTVQATTDTGSADITYATTWAFSPATTGITCTFQSPHEICTADSTTTAGAYTLTVSYPGTTETGTATLSVTP